LTVVDDATREGVAIVPDGLLADSTCYETWMGWRSRGLPQAIRTDNGKEFCGRDMLTWAHERDVKLFLIEPGKLNRNAYINGRFCKDASTSIGSPAYNMSLSMLGTTPRHSFITQINYPRTLNPGGTENGGTSNFIKVSDETAQILFIRRSTSFLEEAQTSSVIQILDFPSNLSAALRPKRRIG
jgi:hypothetical protein